MLIYVTEIYLSCFYFVFTGSVSECYHYLCLTNAVRKAHKSQIIQGYLATVCGHIGKAIEVYCLMEISRWVGI
jgi:hypothetical protein